MVKARFIRELDSLERVREEWDALALSNGLPLMAPGWVLAWWRHIAPRDGLLRAIEMRDGGELVGLAPFFVVPPRRSGRVVYHMCGIGLGAPLAPLSAPGREWHVAQAISQALTQAEPSPDLIALRATPLAGRWNEMMRDCWPGRVRPLSAVYSTQGYPTVSLQGASLEEWLASRSSHFRSSMRRLGSRFREAGGSWRLSTEPTLEDDVETFQRLHAARWRGRGFSRLLTYGSRLGAMLTEAGRTLLGDDRFRLCITEVDGAAIGADIYVCGGGVVTGINGGWDERWKRLSPPLLATMHMIEDSIGRGEQRVDLGPGNESHKTRFANGNRPVASSVLITPGPHLAQTAMLTAPMLAGGAARQLAKRFLKPEQVHTLRQMQQRASARAGLAHGRRRAREGRRLLP
jgi:CelD/BcsL family acetyltransferase involved in cellulose biosynthesis